ncbi:MAG: ABC transporter ATP-binding protein [Zetaproteobacteria bacterium]|nr:ABC transporter ATP-binding protein [Zetaproteobacteria bacterium]
MRVLYPLFKEVLLQERRKVLLVLLGLVVMSLAQSAVLLVLGPFLRFFFESDPQLSTYAIRDLLPVAVRPDFLMDYQGVLHARDLALAIPLAVLAAGLLRCLANYLYQTHSAQLAMCCAHHYRQRVYHALLERPFMELQGKTPAGWMALVMQDVVYLQQKSMEWLNAFVRDGAIMLAALTTLAYLHWPSALLVVLLAPLIARGMGRTGLRIAKYAAFFQRELAEISALVLGQRQRFQMIKIAGAEAYEQDKLAQRCVQYYDKMRQSFLVRFSFAPFLEFLGFCIFAALVVACNRKMAFFADIAATEVMTLFATVGMLLRPLRNMGEQFSSLYQAKGALAEGLELLQHASTQPRHVVCVPSSVPKLPLSLKIAQIVIVDLDQQPLFKGQQMVIPLGAPVAIVGASGGGKSTLVRALAGLVRPQLWQANVDFDVWQAHVNFVSQAPFFFSGTLRENLCYGCERPPSPQQLEQALSTAHCLEFVQALPAGLDTPFDALGGGVSGGQLQRLVLARALLRPGPVLIVDEPTASLDEELHHRVMISLLQFCRRQQMTLICVTHRVEHLHLFSKVFQVTDGSIAEQPRLGTVSSVGEVGA